MLFHGEMIERIGPRSYKITKGAFTSCVQPTPRWQLVASSFTLHLDSYAWIMHPVLKVKGGARLLHAGPRLSHPGGRPRHRTADAHLRGVPLPGIESEQRLLLGDRPQSGRHLLPRLVHAARRRRPRRRVPLHARQRVGGRHPLLPPQRAGSGDPVPRRYADPRPAAEPGVSREPPAGPAGGLDRARPDRLLHRHHRPADVPRQHLRCLQLPALHVGQRERPGGRIRAERHLRLQRDLLRYGLGDQRGRPAHWFRPGQDGVVRSPAVLLVRRRVRQAVAKLAPGAGRRAAGGGPGTQPVRPVPRAAVSVQSLALPEDRHDSGVASHVLGRERRREGTGRRRGGPPVPRDVRAGDRALVHQDLGHPRTAATPSG